LVFSIIIGAIILSIAITKGLFQGARALLAMVIGGGFVGLIVGLAEE